MNLTKTLVKSILEHAGSYEWSLQGFGMLRTYLSKEVRLHVWDSRFAVPNVSTLHDHPWDFVSQVIAGRVEQYRYDVWREPRPGKEHVPCSKPYLSQTILCGPGGCAKTAPEMVHLVSGPREFINEGQIYRQDANEVHESLPECGTVTVIERTFKADTEHARVFWPVGTEWVSAEPRKATSNEVHAIIYHSLATWF